MINPSRSGQRAGVTSQAFTTCIVTPVSASRQDAKRVKSKSIQLPKPCWACGYGKGLVIPTLQPEHPGLIKCGRCDVYQGTFEQAAERRGGT